MNITAVSGNSTQALTQLEKLDAVFRLVYMILTLICFSFFLYLTGVLLWIFYGTLHLQENSRYVLLAHILITDTIYLGFGTFLVMALLHTVYFPVPLCLLVLAVASTSYRVTPYTLAVMSLERYVAICFPLRHLEFCSAHRANFVIVVVWVIGFSPSIADFVAIVCSVKTDFFSHHFLCNHSMLVISPLQNVIRSIAHILSFILVVLILLFTYVKVMLVAKRIGSQRSSAQKAGKTISLHVVHLILCMVSFITSVAETTLPDYHPAAIGLDFLLFTCLPRLLCPLIYGVRDEAFKKYIRKMFFIESL
ncbi:odorant receptor 131-2-like [Hyperolius riggenbachi]|uniref:odorant receptor 131-2-like n=1 Tax=Hyperolius riggenbachi TaxID=752182 RepID=UPI0035A399EE